MSASTAKLETAKVETAATAKLEYGGKSLVLKVERGTVGPDVDRKSVV